MVVAVISILVAIIIPSIGGAQTSAKRAKTRVQFSQWSAAIEQFRQEYGYYPAFPSHRVNAAPTENDERLIVLFREVLTGRTAATSGTTFLSSEKDASPQNKKRITFCDFSTSDLSGSRISDAFGNTDIIVLMDRDMNGRIALGTVDYPLSTDTPSVLPGNLQAPWPDGGLRAGVAFYSAGDGQRPVTSW